MVVLMNNSKAVMHQITIEKERAIFILVDQADHEKLMFLVIAENMTRHKHKENNNVN